jgi:hypothetical protein
MIDVILLTFVAAVYVAGIWTGAKYGDVRTCLSKSWTWIGKQFDKGG